MLRRSGFGIGCRSGSAVSMVASTHDPSRTMPANIRIWLTVRPNSPCCRPSG
ncbi:MAG: hypothetical protein R3F11_31885 [Verrucomicrobiales bacterium]